MIKMLLFFRGVAQPGSAFVWGAKGRGFESRHSDHPSRLRRYGWQATQAEKVCEGVSPEVSTKGDKCGMFYVYLIKSISFPEQKYIGVTDDLHQKL